MKNSNETIGNRTRDLPACSAVPQTTALARAPKSKIRDSEIMDIQEIIRVFVRMSTLSDEK